MRPIDANVVDVEINKMIEGVLYTAAANFTANQNAYTTGMADGLSAAKDYISKVPTISEWINLETVAETSSNRTKGAETMGWGYYLEARRNHGTDHEERRELIYWHKFDDLYHNILGIVRYEVPNLAEEHPGPDEVVVDKAQLKAILGELVCLEDYWADHEGEVLVPGVNCTNGFGTVTKLCEIIAQYDLITEKGWEIVFFYG